MKNLSLHDNDISDLSPLEGLVRLEGLEIDVSSVSDLLFLKNSRNLEQLKIDIEGALPLKCLFDNEWKWGDFRVRIGKFV